MILYHGTNTDFFKIDLHKSNPYKDFGRVFYLTNIRSQAQELAAKKCTLFGGTPIVQEYNFDEEALSDLNVLRFDKPSKEWAEFVFNNRSRSSGFSHSFDVVIGPIANDGVAYLLGRYEEGTLSLDELAKELEYKGLNNQYFFGTIKAIAKLHRI